MIWIRVHFRSQQQSVYQGDCRWACIRCSVNSTEELSRNHSFVSTASPWRWNISNENSGSDPSCAVYYTQLFAIIPTCLPFKFPWRKVEKNVLSIRGFGASVMCDSSRKLRRVQLFPLNTKDSSITSRLRRTSSWRKQPELSATSLTPCSHPPTPATIFPNHPPGIENSTGPCLRKGWMWNIAYKKLEALEVVDTELLWVQAVWSHGATDYLKVR